MKKVVILLFTALVATLAGCTSGKKTVAEIAPPAEQEKILTGDLTYEEIITELPRWKKHDEAVELNPEEVVRLAEVGRKIEIVCYLGTWCPDSRGAVPHFTRALEVADNPNIVYRIVGLNRDKDDPPLHTALKMDVQRVPTFILYESDNEIGRLIEYPVMDNFVLDVLDLLSSK